MTIQLNHIIVWCEDQKVSSDFFARILGLPEPETFYHFLVVRMENDVSLDFMKKEGGSVARQHYAFLIDEQRFDEVFVRIKAEGVSHWADPARSEPDAINHNDGGRGVYFEDPNGHLLEVITRPYGAAQTADAT
jgi:catechol 2,3-dioxygenase-like lactoylglutathione lyase family enzyme